MDNDANIFGFSTDPQTTDFLPIIKYNALAGNFSRVDREAGSDGKFVSIPEVLPYDKFKAIFDFENAETGWLLFTAVGAPSMVLVSLEEVTANRIKLPPKPSDDHKTGIRMVVKLSPQNAGGKPPIRELASNARAFLRGMAPVYRQYLNERAAHPGLLPVLMLDGHPLAEKSTGRQQSATTFRPVFKIVSWTARGDLKPLPRGKAAATNGAGVMDEFTAAPARPAAASAARPDTGATRAAPPKQPDANLADDFG